MAGIGKTEKLGGDEVSEVKCLLFDYDSGKAEIKSAHMKYVKEKVVPILTKGGSLTVIGMASRFGNEAANKSLSSQRARQALTFLKSLAPKIASNIYEVTVKGAGTTVAKNQLQPEGSDNERYRSVYVSVWNKKEPPPVPPPDTKLPDGSQVFQGVQPVAPLPSDSAGDTAGKWLDVISGGTGIAEIGAIILGFEAAAATAVAGILSAVTGVVSALLSTPLAWAGAEKIATFNGRCQGFWEAMQDMASQYKSTDLDKKAFDEWPALTKPSIHVNHDNDANLSINEKCWREGQETGKNEAYKAISDLDSKPMPIRVKIVGKEYQVNAKIALRVLYKWKGSDVGDSIKAAMNKKLKAAGKSEWPTRG